MLLAELLKDDVKDSLYCKTKDYYVGDVGKVAYKGYLIIETSSGEFIVEKEGHRICTKNSLADAKKDIDYLTQDSKSEEVGTSDSCKVGDVAFGGKGYKCTKCHATADSVHKIVHVKDDSESKLYEIENEVSNKIW